MLSNEIEERLAEQIVSRINESNTFILEKIGNATAIRNLIETREYSPSYALIIAEELNDTCKLLDVDYESFAEYLEEKNK